MTTTTSSLSTSDHPDELADPVGGTWHIETAAPETGTAHTIRVDHIFVSHALGKRRGAPGSDHRPVLASINV